MFSQTPPTSADRVAEGLISATASAVRPSLNPSFLGEMVSGCEDAPPRTPWWGSIVATGRAAAWAVWRLLSGSVRLLRFVIRANSERPLAATLSAATLRLAALPIVLAGGVAVSTVLLTHPPRTPSTVDPLRLGLYVEPVAMLTSDRVRLAGWLVPATSERDIRKASAWTTERPGVVLIHDFADNRESLLPWVRPLHEAGFVVLAIDARGCGQSGRAAQTLGLHESADVRAALDVLRRRRLVDPNRLAVVGVGTGGVAAAACVDEPGVRAVVAIDPLRPDDAIRRHLTIRHDAPIWQVRTLRHTFTLLYGHPPEGTHAGSTPPGSIPAPEGLRTLRRDVHGRDVVPQGVGFLKHRLAS